jgi:hypothetical protein
MTKPDTSKPERPATSPRPDYVGPIAFVEEDPDNVGSVEARIVESESKEV